MLAHLTTCDEIDSFRLQLLPDTALLCGYASCVSQCGRCSAARKMLGAPSLECLGWCFWPQCHFKLYVKLHHKQSISSRIKVEILFILTVQLISFHHVHLAGGTCTISSIRLKCTKFKSYFPDKVEHSFRWFFTISLLPPVWFNTLQNLAISCG